MARDSAAADPRNLRRAGSRPNSSRTVKPVPTGAGFAVRRTTCAPTSTACTPTGSSAAREMTSTSAAAAIDGSASPRKPSVCTCPRSAAFSILLVAWRSKASSRSPGGMPRPSSVTRMRVTPPSSVSTVTRVLPASMALSRSSRTTETGRSITSPAAMRAATSGGSTRMERARTLVIASPAAARAPAVRTASGWPRSA